MINNVIYGDVLLIINFCMDFLALYITAKIMHIKLLSRKITLSAALGALYSLFVLLFNITGLFGGVLGISVSFLLTCVAFGKQNGKVLVKNTAVFFGVSFTMGGGITALCNLLNIWKNSRNIVVNGTFDVLYGDVPFGILIVLGAICGFISLIYGKTVKQKASKKEYDLHITLNGREAVIRSFSDSGNLLKEPISGKPVVIATFNSLRKIIPPELFDVFKNRDTSPIYSSKYSTKLRLIPTSTVNQKGLLFGIIPDGVVINEKNVDVYVAITPDSESFGGFDAIVPNEII